MSDTGDMPMRAVFLGGPADGGELVLREPVSVVVRFPITAALVDYDATDVQIVQARIPVAGGDVPDSAYDLSLDPDSGRPVLNRGRLIYLYRLPVKTPTEGPSDE